MSTFDYMKRIDHKFNIECIIAWRAGAMMRKAEGGRASCSAGQQREVTRTARRSCDDWVATSPTTNSLMSHRSGRALARRTDGSRSGAPAR
jgi:hypothetical protein